MVHILKSSAQAPRTFKSSEMVTVKGWKRFETQENPSGRYGHRAICYMHKMILFGGYNGKDRLNDTYEFDLGLFSQDIGCNLNKCGTEKRVWTRIDATTPSSNNNEPTVPSTSTTTTPAARDCHSAVLYKRKMYVFGGGDGYKWLNDMFAYDIATQTWSEVKPSEGSLVPTGRAGHSAIVHKGKMIVFGGWNGRRTLNDLYEFYFGSFFFSK